VGLLVGAVLEGVGISLQAGDVTFDELVASPNKEKSRQQSKRVMDHTIAAAKDLRFWIFPVLLATGLGAFFAHTEHRDGTAFHFETKRGPWWETYHDHH
jgi:hypothetical protein